VGDPDLNDVPVLEALARQQGVVVPGGGATWVRPVLAVGGGVVVLGLLVWVFRD
jgi:hypothetical protein